MDFPRLFRETPPQGQRFDPSLEGVIEKGLAYEAVSFMDLESITKEMGPPRPSGSRRNDRLIPNGWLAMRGHGGRHDPA